jgi:site-specific DNA recombinase
MERTVNRITPTVPELPKKLRVAAYARVSSGKDAMLQSLSAQISYYSELIQRNSGWEYSGVYADEAVTGTKDARDEFQKLIAECRAGRIDLVLTKSISRFARNTVTLLESVRELKKHNVDVYFERENIHSMSGDGELMLSILASFAQEESLSTSENCKWRIRNYFKDGIPSNLRIYGYDCVGRQLVVYAAESAVVRMIYADYLNGMGKNAIVRKLIAMAVPTKNGCRWSESAIVNMLQDEKYTGDMLLQKTFSENHLTNDIARPGGLFGVNP